MSAPTYTVRVVNDEEGIVAWIDIDGAPVIRQPHAPGFSEPWATEAEAKNWADKHAADLLAQYEAAKATEARKKEIEDAQHAANLASIETSKALQALVAHLANPSA